MAKCLVLGANGFIGSHLVDALVEAGHEVRAFDRFGDKQSVRFKPSDKAKPFKGDFLNRGDIRRALDGIDYVFHFISTTTPATAENDPLIDIETNVKGSINLFEECVSQNIKKVIFASTGGAIYGSTSGKPISEQSVPAPVSPYAIGKLTIEHYLHYFNKKHGLKSLVFRISNPYGERHALNAKQGVINVFLEHMAENKPITVLGDGSMIRDYIYVKDVASMIVAGFETAQEEMYNLGSGQGISLNELIEAIEKVVGRPLEKNHKPVPPTFVDKIVLDVGLFNRKFNIAPSTSLEAGIQKTWQYIQQAKQGARHG